MDKKMADVDIDPFEEHGKIDEPTDENIPLSPVGEGGSTWEPEPEQETSFGGEKLKKEDSPILMSTVCTRSCLSITNEPQMKSINITLDVKASNHFLRGRDEPLTKEDGS